MSGDMGNIIISPNDVSFTVYSISISILFVTLIRPSNKNVFLNGFGSLFMEQPMFFSHHAFIDKIWWDWQRTDGNGGKFGGTHGPSPASLDTRMLPWGRTVREIIEELSTCIRYVGGGIGSSRMIIPTLERATAVQQSTTKVEPAKIKNIPVKRKVQKMIAEKKISRPRLYVTELTEAVAVLNAMKRALQKIKAPPSFIHRAEKSYMVVEQMIGVDIEDAWLLTTEPDTAVMEDGKRDMNALEKGMAPPGKADDDVEI